MNHHPARLSEGYESYLRIIAGAAAGKAEKVFAEYARFALDCALKGGSNKGDAVERIRNAGVAAGLADGVMDRYWPSAVEYAEAEPARRNSVPAAAAQPVGNEARHLVVRRASDIEPEAIDWIWWHRIALGKLWLVAGEPGLGKSQLASMVVATVTKGGEWPCGEGRAKSGSVIMLCAEDGAADTIVPRLMAAGADLGRVHIVSAVADGQRHGNRGFNLQADLDLLETLLARISDVRLIVIDPISSYMGKVDSHKNADVRSVLEAVGELAGRHRVALLGITHFSKGGGQKAINQFIGSIAFVAAARTAYAVMADPDDETRRLFMPVKNNLAPMGHGLAFRIEQRLLPGEIVASSITFDVQPVTGTADGILALTHDVGGGHGRTEKAEAIEFLSELLAAGSLTAKTVKAHATEAGISPKSLRSARQELKVKTEKSGFEGGWVWTLPRCPRRDEDAQ